MNFNSHSAVFLLFALIGLGACTSIQKQKPTPPNIVYILADDLGYGDVSVLNSQSKLHTPHIDQLAKEGMTFSDAHSNSSVCTPTRYGILTGQYCWRSRIKKGVLLGYSPSLIEENTPTVAKFLQDQGYTTACIGKWHLGIDFKLKDGTYHSGEPGVEFTNELKSFKDHEKIDFGQAAKGGPKGAGFDYSYILPASLDFQPYMYLENNLAVEAPTDTTPGNDLDAEPWATGAFWRRGQMAPSFRFQEVLPTFTRKATEFLSQQKDSEKPFFLYFPMNAPHTPWVATDEFAGTSAVGQYGDFVQMVDHQIGLLMKSLKDNGLEENTIVIFTSDNGGYWRSELIEKYNHRSNHTFRGMKSDVWEGGHHIPFFVKWPEKVKAGSTCNETICLTDLFATVKNLFDPKLKVTEDSYSILPLIREEQEPHKRAAVIHHSGGGKFGIRDGDWKLIEGLGSGGFTKPAFRDPLPGEPEGQLYNLSSDPLEQKNLYLEKPEKVEELKAKLKEIRGY